jgi:anhydro-N-acetylmuramic acid kinase
LHRLVGASFRDAANAVIAKCGGDKAHIKAIGSHGQTLRHQPDAARPFSLQIGDADIIARDTGITTVANFRQADIDAGGQGAPLVPPFHDCLFRSPVKNRVVLNIGGIANITVLPSAGSPITGFDTGPGNTLMDNWIREQRGLDFDGLGEWAADGEVIDALLHECLGDAYFHQLPPKSTGFEYFNQNWLDQKGVDQYRPGDVQATLCELTASTIASAIHGYANNTDEVFVCGGGVHNTELMRRLANKLEGVVVENTNAAGLDPDWVEAVAFAWLAMRTFNGQTGNLPSVTGASHKVVLGAIHSP